MSDFVKLTTPSVHVDTQEATPTTAYIAIDAVIAVIDATDASPVPGFNTALVVVGSEQVPLYVSESAEEVVELLS